MAKKSNMEYIQRMESAVCNAHNAMKLLKEENIKLKERINLLEKQLNNYENKKNNSIKLLERLNTTSNSLNNSNSTSSAPLTPLPPSNPSNTSILNNSVNNKNKTGISFATPKFTTKSINEISSIKNDQSRNQKRIR